MSSQTHPFIVGQIYNRSRQIHGMFSGQRQGGISTPIKAPLILLFTNESGAAFGYEDSFRPDGTFWFTGEGQSGDMKMAKGNTAIANHAKVGKKILLFESVPGNGRRFLGEAEYLGHHIEQRPDVNHALRDAIIFHLGLLPPGLGSDTPNREHLSPKNLTSKLPSKLSLSALRDIALETIPPDASLEEKKTNVARRTEAIKRYALLRAQGTCEACLVKAPFLTKKGPFLEVHHVLRLADGGPDHPANVVAICPNCHRRAHYSIDAGEYNAVLISWLKEHEEF